jgi:anaerobic magnesium-protoporphyrin IX monomethyl ester cyclase
MNRHFSQEGKNPYIVFVYPPSSSAPDEVRRAHFKMCLGSAYIIAYLAQNSFTARQFVTAEPVNAKECALRILAVKPKITGFTVDNTNYFFCLFIAQALKQLDPNMIILFGGFMPTIHAEVILQQNPFVDICSRNESEETCLELLSQLDDVHFDLKKASLQSVKGITYRIDEQIFKTPDRNIILANRHIPDFLDKYPSPYLSGTAGSSKLGIITARGCSQSCVYCFCPVMSRRKIATHSVDRVIAELDYIAGNLVGDNPPVVDIFDDTFTLLPGRALEICKKIIENKIKLPLSCITRCDKVDEELLEALKQAGTRSIELSLESAVPRLLRIIGKVQPPHTKDDNDFQKEKEFIEKFKKYITYAKKIGIENVFTSIMIGLPTETPEEAQQTIDLVQSFSESIDFYGHNIFRVHPGTPLFSYYEKYGFKLVQHDSRVFYDTILTYDARQIPVAPKSHFEILGKQRDLDNTTSLAFSLSSSKEKDKTPNLNYFNKIILCADIITQELILWLQKYLAINGTFIQIYTDIDRAKEHYRDNEDRVYKYSLPTQYREAYYPAKREDGVVTLTPYRIYLLSERCGIPINRVDTRAGILQGKLNPVQSICIDRPAEKQDVLQLHRLLKDISREESAMSVLFNHPTYPYFSSLCRWEKREPNCRQLETVIVDPDNNVKTCWNGKPIGTVGMPLPEIGANLKEIHERTVKERGCGNCHKQAECAGCIFPAPISGKEYCDLKREFNIEEAAEVMRTFDMFKELSMGGVIRHHGGLC